MKTVLKIEGMSCEHCVKHVKEAISGCENVVSVSVSLEEGTAAIEHTNPVSIEAITAAIDDAGYEVVS